jgi:hypothetical protein
MNLVKDQVAGLLGDSSHANALAPLPPTKAEVAAPADVKPLVLAPVKNAEAATEPAVAAELREPSQPQSLWSLSAFAGPSMHFIDNHHLTSPWGSGREYQLEAQRTLQDWTVGAALDMGDGVLMPVVALAAFIGDGWQRGRLRLDASAGLGLELTDRMLINCTYVDSSITGQSSSCARSYELRPRLYGRGNLTLLWSVRRTFSLTLRVALHLETDVLAYSSGSALLGLCMNLP